MPRANAYRLFRKVAGFNPQAQNGVVAILASPSAIIDHDTVDDIIENFGSVLVDTNALRTDEGIFEAVGRLAPTELPQGLDTVLRTLVTDTDPAVRGRRQDLPDLGRRLREEVQLALGPYKNLGGEVTLEFLGRSVPF